MAEKRTRLRLKRIDRIALVDKGDNPTADVVIHKRAPSAPPVPATPPAPTTRWRAALAAVGKALGWPEDAAPVAKDDPLTFDEIRGARRASEDVWRFTSDLASAFGRVLESEEADKSALLTASLDQFEAAVKDAIPTWVGGEEVEKQPNQEPAMAEPTTKTDPTPAPAPAPSATVSKADFDTLAKRLEDAETARKASDERVQKLELERRTETFVAKARAFTHLPVKAEELGVILRKIADGEKLSEAELKEHDRVMAAANESSRAGALFIEIGSGATEGSATAKAEAEAQKLIAADPKLTKEAALGKVYRADQQLRKAAEREEKDAVTAARAAP